MFSSSIFTQALTLGLLSAKLAQAQIGFGAPCSIYGPDFVAPQHPSKDAAVVKAIAALTKALTASFSDPEPYGLLDNSTTFSVDVYSLYEEDSIFTHHYTAPAVAISTDGDNKVDSDSVYRLGSVSKLITVFLFLIEAGDVSWNEPITKYLPELGNVTQVDATNRIDNVDWSEVTIGALANQLAGLGRLHPTGLQADALITLPGWPLPDEPAVSAELCLAGNVPVPCNRTQFFESFLTRPPIVSAFETPIYSNDAYSILGYVLESMTGKALPDIFTNSLTAPLDLKVTSFYPPTTNAKAVAPINATVSGYNANIRSIIPVGGYYSSTNEMRTLGKAILNSTLLTPGQTRRWMKPHSVTADPRQIVGAPWEFVRAPTSITNRLSYIPAKLGDVGAYSTMVGYFPEFGVGFTILTAFVSKSQAETRATLGNIVMDFMYPALEKAAKAEAIANYAGTYKDAATNSTFVVSSDQHTGLDLVAWTQNGTDVRSQLLAASRNVPTAYTRLIPTGLTNVDASTGKTAEVSYRVIPSSKVFNNKTLPVSSVCEAWVLMDQPMYGRYGLDSIVFEVDGNGKATGVVPKALVGTKLTRLA